MSIDLPDNIAFPPTRRGTPTWEMVLEYPLQGDWRDYEYMALDTHMLIEFTDGVLEFLPTPSVSHQRILRFLRGWLQQHVVAHGNGEVFIAPCPVRIRPGKFREPDIFVIRSEHKDDADGIPTGAEVVVEVVNDGEEARKRDLVTKRKEYAEAAIPEYWIVDPETTTVTVLTLDKTEYRTHGQFRPGDAATSVLLPNFEVAVTSLFEAGESSPAI